MCIYPWHPLSPPFFPDSRRWELPRWLPACPLDCLSCSAGWLVAAALDYLKNRIPPARNCVSRLVFMYQHTRPSEQCWLFVCAPVRMHALYARVCAFACTYAVLRVSPLRFVLLAIGPDSCATPREKTRLNRVNTVAEDLRAALLGRAASKIESRAIRGRKRTQEENSTKVGGTRRVAMSSTVAGGVGVGGLNPRVSRESLPPRVNIYVTEAQTRV